MRLARVAQGVLLVVFAGNVYRAATQSVVHDEALTYRMFLAGPWSGLFDFYSANHHVLNTILAKLTTSLLGVSEFTLRLPSLLGGALYLGSAFLACRLLFGEGVIFLASLGALTLHPFVLDFLSVARGYGMALGLWLFSLYHLLKYLGEAPRRKYLYLAALGAGLAITANLTFVFPVAATGLAVLFELALRPKPAETPEKRKEKRKKRRSEDPARQASVSAALLHFALPGALLAWLILAGPISHAARGDFYTGAGTLLDGARSMVRMSFSKLSDRPAILLGPGWPTDLALAAVTLLAGWAVAVTWRAGRLRVPAVATVAAAVLVLIAHALFDLPYPEGRTGLYWFPLITLTAAAAWRLSEASRTQRVVWAGVFTAVLIQFALQFSLGPYAVWRYDGSARAIADILEARQTANPGTQVRVGATWQLEPSLNFYREIRGYKWMAPISRQGPAGNYDYYALWEQDRVVAGHAGMRTLLEDRGARTVLAAAK